MLSNFMGLRACTCNQISPFEGSACVATSGGNMRMCTSMQTKIRNLGLDDKQRRLTEARNAYQAEKQRLSQLYGPAQELRSEAEAAQDVVNRKVSC